MIQMSNQIAGYFQNLSEDQLLGHLAGCGNLKYCIINALERYELSEYLPLTHLEMNLDAFWAFNEDIQVHFKKEPSLLNPSDLDMWHLVFVGTASKFPPVFLESNSVVDLSENYEQGRQKLLLWGERKPHQSAWYELRIPRALNYPWMKAGDIPERIAVDILTYALGGRVEFFRYTGLSGWEEE